VECSVHAIKVAETTVFTVEIKREEKHSFQEKSRSN